MTRRPRVAFVVNGDPKSAMAERARSFAARLTNSFDPRLVYRVGGKATAGMLRGIAAARPAACYVLDLAAPGVLAAGLYKHGTGTPFVLDTGDAVVELGRALGRSRIGVAATQAMETYAIRAAAAVVVRGTYHRHLLAQRGVKALVIPDGVSVDQFEQRSGSSTDLARPLVIGLVGSCVWVPARQTCYGWELVEVVRLLRNRLPRPIRGVLVGDGSGIHILRRRAVECKVEDAVEFAGRVPFADLPCWLRKFDICLSTQTNDVIGNVRTTGKLPLYLAAGRFVLASQVGEAARVLPKEMLVEFAGDSDPNYPAKLAERVEQLVRDSIDFSYRPECVRIAREQFEYDLLACRVATVLQSILDKSNCHLTRQSAYHDP